MILTGICFSVSGVGSRVLTLVDPSLVPLVSTWISLVLTSKEEDKGKVGVWGGMLGSEKEENNKDSQEKENSEN